MNLQTGAFGDPASLDTLILFWTKMDMLHYPGAGETKRYLEEKLRAQQEQQRAMMAMAAGQQQAQQAQADAQTIGAVLQKAKQDAQAAAQQQGQALLAQNIDCRGIAPDSRKITAGQGVGWERGGKPRERGMDHEEGICRQHQQQRSPGGEGSDASAEHQGKEHRQDR